MKVRKFIAVLVFALIIGGIGAKQGWAYMQKSYGGSCAKLDGFPGLLQRMNLLALGDCAMNKNNKCKNPGAMCAVRSSTGAVIGSGTCTNAAKLDCQCVPN